MGTTAAAAAAAEGEGNRKGNGEGAVVGEAFAYGGRAYNDAEEDGSTMADGRRGRAGAGDASPQQAQAQAQQQQQQQQPAAAAAVAQVVRIPTPTGGIFVAPDGRRHPSIDSEDPSAASPFDEPYYQQHGGVGVGEGGAGFFSLHDASSTASDGGASLETPTPHFTAAPPAGIAGGAGGPSGGSPGHTTPNMSPGPPIPEQQQQQQQEQQQRQQQQTFQQRAGTPNLGEVPASSQQAIIEQMQRAVVDSSNSLINNSHASHTLYDQSIEYSVDGAMLEPPSHMLSAARLYGRGIAQKTLPPFGSSSKKGPPPEFYIPVNVAFVPGRCM